MTAKPARDRRPRRHDRYRRRNRRWRSAARDVARLTGLGPRRCRRGKPPGTGRLSAVIDFGSSGGDPACDLAIAWTLFAGESRETFRAAPLDDATWARGRGWTLWKPLITLAALPGTNALAASASRRIIDDVLADHGQAAPTRMPNRFDGQRRTNAGLVGGKASGTITARPGDLRDSPALPRGREFQNRSEFVDGGRCRGHQEDLDVADPSVARARSATVSSSGEPVMGSRPGLAARTVRSGSSRTASARPTPSCR